MTKDNDRMFGSDVKLLQIPTPLHHRLCTRLLRGAQTLAKAKDCDGSKLRTRHLSSFPRYHMAERTKTKRPWRHKTTKDTGSHHTREHGSFVKNQNNYRYRTTSLAKALNVRNRRYLSRNASKQRVWYFCVWPQPAMTVTFDKKSVMALNHHLCIWDQSVIDCKLYQLSEKTLNWKSRMRNMPAAVELLISSFSLPACIQSKQLTLRSPVNLLVLERTLSWRPKTTLADS